MPSNRFVSEIERSLAPRERFADFAYLFDALMSLRRPYHQDTPQSETITGKLLCVIFPDKPAKYITLPPRGEHAASRRHSAACSVRTSPRCEGTPGRCS
jgi:hypothetical protein